MIDKRVANIADAVADIKDGATVLMSGFGGAGSPTELLHAVLDQGARDLIIVSNNPGSGEVGLGALVKEGRVAKVVCSFPRTSGGYAFAERFKAGKIELELVPQGTLAERIRCGGAGIPAFYTPTGAGTPVAEGKEVRDFNGHPHLLEHAIIGDVALVKAHKADRWGNLVYNKTARNFGPIMCMSARIAIVQVKHFVDVGELDPEVIVSPGIFVDRVVEVPDAANEQEMIEAGIKRKPQ